MTQPQGAAAMPAEVPRPRPAPTGTVLWLDDPEATVLSRAGGKGANLARLCQAGLPVPAGFVVGTEVYRRFVDEAGLGSLIARTAGEVAVADVDAAAAASATLLAAFEAAPVPHPVAEAIAAAWRQLGGGPAAVRSSATAEDLPEASFAGQQDTVLGVTGADHVTAAVRRCWSSLWTARALAYRAGQGIGHADVAAAVVVQRMVAADAAGVLFTADPLTGRRDHVMVEAVRGLAEPLVGGRVTPQRWVVDGPTRAVLTAPEATGQEPPLDEAHLRALTALGLRAADVLGAPQDVEWAIVGDRCWIVQSRPITSLFPVPAAPEGAAGLRVYMPLNLVAQGTTAPFTPAGCAFFVATATRTSAYWSLRRKERWQASWLPAVLGRLFYDVTPFVASPGWRHVSSPGSGSGTRRPPRRSRSGCAERAAGWPALRTSRSRGACRSGCSVCSPGWSWPRPVRTVRGGGCSGSRRTSSTGCSARRQVGPQRSRGWTSRSAPCPGGLWTW